MTEAVLVYIGEGAAQAPVPKPIPSARPYQVRRILAPCAAMYSLHSRMLYCP